MEQVEEHEGTNVLGLAKLCDHDRQCLRDFHAHLIRLPALRCENNESDGSETPREHWTLSESDDTVLSDDQQIRIGQSQGIQWILVFPAGAAFDDEFLLPSVLHADKIRPIQQETSTSKTPSLCGLGD